MEISSSKFSTYLQEIAAQEACTLASKIEEYCDSNGLPNAAKLVQNRKKLELVMKERILETIIPIIQDRTALLAG